jgi:hypothetical protein
MSETCVLDARNEGIRTLEGARPRYGVCKERSLSQMKRKVIAALLAVGALSITAAPAVADPSFGPGNSGGGPHDANAKCHPPGQTTTTPGCK